MVFIDMVTVTRENAIMKFYLKMAKLLLVKISFKKTIKVFERKNIWKLDYVLVYLSDIGLTLEENSRLAKIRKSFIRVLIEQHRIQIKEVW